MTGLGARLHQRMRGVGITNLVSVANGEGFGLYQAFKQHGDCRVIEACREGEAVGICAGLVLGGSVPVLSIENFGLFECLDTLRALPIALRLPLILVIGYTGRVGLTPEGERAMQERLGQIAPQAILGARWTEPVLELAGIPYWHIAPDEDAAAFDAAHAQALRDSVPVALLVDLT